MAPDASQETFTARLERLRAHLRDASLAGFVVPRADAHQGEYVPPNAERLRWLTGFDGSAGMAIVLADRAALFVDGRYTLAARDQVDTGAYEIRHSINEPAADWLHDHLGKGDRLAYDPWLHTVDGRDRLERACGRAGAALVAVDNPIDLLWRDRPGPPAAPFEAHPLDYAGKTAADKRAEVAKSLAGEGADAAILTLPDSIAWLLNIRGTDVPRTPFPLCFAILYADATVDLFAPPGKVDAALAAHLGEAVTVRLPEDMEAALASMTDKTVRLDPSSAAVWFSDRLGAAGASVQRGDDPCQLPKACKNPVELDGIRMAHLRDGAALTRFLAWLVQEAPKGGVTEMDAADRLEACRRDSEMLRDLSFDTISGAGPNGAIVHYRVNERTNRPLKSGELYLVDSGGQYPDGTTDVTRTVAIGEPTDAMRRHYTLVLKGHIALGSARFPVGTTGSQLDVLARLPLWRDGLDYDHGTGHGVGAYLSVHEGPQRISKVPNRVALCPGMVVSNEPGYYEAGAYGIRIENLVAVVATESDQGTVLGFETLTLAPFDRALIETGLLDPAEIAWVDDYHAKVRTKLEPILDPETKAWLGEATAVLGV
jgi:Xaa-Pro aminopeptidase